MLQRFCSIHAPLCHCRLSVSCQRPFQTGRRIDSTEAVREFGRVFSVLWGLEAFGRALSDSA